MSKTAATLFLSATLLFGSMSSCQNQSSTMEKGSSEVENPSKSTAYNLKPSQLLYHWSHSNDAADFAINAIQTPAGFSRVKCETGSFAEWLRYLPLKEGRPKVKLYDGSHKGNQQAHFKVIDIDVGDRDLQQCADAVMRLRAEYLYATDATSEINFNFTSGDPHPYSNWLDGKRPVINGNSVSWRNATENPTGYPLFKAYLQSVFNWSGTYSLSKQMRSVPVQELRAGDVFIQGGFPGHAVIVIDVAENTDGDKRFLLAQSYMPAQEMHILRNPANPNDNPWYQIPDNQLKTPEWQFSASDLRRF